jgi:large exoprotein involved in heme utilization and adhesion
VLVTGGSAGQGPLGADCNTAYVVFQTNAKLQVGGDMVITSGSASSASVFGSGKRPPASPPFASS